MIPSLAQDASDPRATALLQRSLEAMGGQEALDALTRTFAHGTTTVFLADREVVSDVTIERQGFLQSRTVARRPGFTQESVSNGRHSWSVVNGEKRSFTEARSAHRIEPIHPLTGIFRAFDQGRLVARLDGEETGPSSRLHRIALHFPDLDSQRLARGEALSRAYELLIDSRSLLPVELRIPPDGWDADYPELWERWLYSDYRSADGALIPFLVEMERYGHRQFRIQLSEFAAAPPTEAFGEPATER